MASAPFHSDAALRASAVSDDEGLKITEFYEHMRGVLVDAGLATSEP